MNSAAGLVVALAPLIAFAQESPQPSLLVRSDLDCRLLIDGKPNGTVSADGSLRVPLPPGEHKIEAVPLTGGASWHENVKIAESNEQALTIPLRATVERFEAITRGYWTDPETHLTWTSSDNGSGVTLNQAEYYCRNLTVGGHKDWTLASIDDLQHLFGGEGDSLGHHVNGPIKLTGWVWSASQGKEQGEEWALDFGDGGRASVVTGDSGLNRALCVRREK